MGGGGGGRQKRIMCTTEPTASFILTSSSLGDSCLTAQALKLQAPCIHFNSLNPFTIHHCHTHSGLWTQEQALPWRWTKKKRKENNLQTSLTHSSLYTKQRTGSLNKLLHMLSYKDGHPSKQTWIKIINHKMHTCQPIQFTGIKYMFFPSSFFCFGGGGGGGYGHTEKWIQEKIIFMRFCCSFKLSKKKKKTLKVQPIDALAKCTLTSLEQ